jgi:hypothetical protein
MKTVIVVIAAVVLFTLVGAIAFRFYSLILPPVIAWVKRRLRE